MIMLNIAFSALHIPVKDIVSQVKQILLFLIEMSSLISKKQIKLALINTKWK